MSRSEPHRPVSLAARWTIADEAFTEFVQRPVSARLKSRLVTELRRGQGRADRQLVAERVYDKETDRLLDALRADQERER